MVVHFISGDGKINQGINCLPTETFAEVEEKLYKIYDEYRETNNMFLAKGNIIKRFKKIISLKNVVILFLKYVNQIFIQKNFI